MHCCVSPTPHHNEIGIVQSVLKCCDQGVEGRHLIGGRESRAALCSLPHSSEACCMAWGLVPEPDGTILASGWERGAFKGQWSHPRLSECASLSVSLLSEALHSGFGLTWALYFAGQLRRYLLLWLLCYLAAVYFKIL